MLAQDPDVLDNGFAVTSKVVVPNEPLYPGPRGSRIEVVDYDVSADAFYGPFEIPADHDPYEDASDIEALVADPAFHAQNVYGVVASTLFEFERALGRHLSWGFNYASHQLKVFPHAFVEANAFYSKKDECLAFGYFPIRGPNSERVYTCLSHDIVAHETTHALIDSLRSQLMRPSSDDQAAFHEGFSDIVALLKTLQNEELVRFGVREELRVSSAGTVSISDAFVAIRKGSFLLGVAAQLGRAVIGMGRDALRRSIDLPPDPQHYLGEDFREAHDRGEILVAAVMRAYLRVWENRLGGKLMNEDGTMQSNRVAAWRIEEEGSKAARHLLQIFIRALDYLPPVHVDFGDFLSAALTADWQICPEDKPYGYRQILRECFGEFGIKPASTAKGLEPGVWGAGTGGREIRFMAGNIESMRWNREGMFRLIWDNYDVLDLQRDVFTRVNSVRPVWRVGPDGFVLRETVAEYYQLNKSADKSDLRKLKIKTPDFMNDSDRVELVGGGTLIFDEYGRLKFHIHNRISNAEDQYKRLMSLWRRGGMARRDKGALEFAEMHTRRGNREPSFRDERWD
ncbi:MAG: hypothetical protein AAGF28_00965 [Pseudomonadota bacterium]